MRPSLANFPAFPLLPSIWRGLPGDEADVPASKLPFTDRIWTLSFPLQSCQSRYNCVVIFLQGLFFASTSDSFVAGTSASSPGVPRHMKIKYCNETEKEWGGEGKRESNELQSRECHDKLPLRHIFITLTLEFYRSLENLKMFTEFRAFRLLYIP